MLEYFRQAALARHTGQSEERIASDFNREVFLSAEEAREYGIIDDVFVGAEELLPTAAAV
ncbi:MAG: ATP-dependent Clp protease proteolytic subunit [Chloroflexota bacterium]|nr:ATP-dependent Clp protease proteolytic subunit [Chloroflexota bacterium]